MFHEVNDVVDAVVEVEGGAGFDEGEKGGGVEGAGGGFHLVEEGEHGVDGAGAAEVAEEFVEDGGVGGEAGLGRGPLEEAERGGGVRLAAEEVEELGGGEVRGERVVGGGGGGGEEGAAESGSEGE